ncbi:MAG: hypothetical protein [Bacteriophage sp.]|nr:MAG: hypothetical protein [Bacteriophage sp.]
MTTILDKDIDLWTAFVEDAEYRVRNAPVDCEAKLIQELHLIRKVRDSMAELLDFKQLKQWP